MFANACALALAALLPAVTAFAQEGDGEPAEPRPVEVVRENAAALRDLMESDLGRAFVDAAQSLPEIHDTRVAYYNRATREALSEADALALSEDERAPYTRYELGESFYYNTFYGTPAAYSRAIDLAGQNGLDSPEGLRVFDFGFGGIGHLRMLASLGAQCAGVEVLELLDVYYTDDDTGTIENDHAPDGRITLLYGSFPGDEQIAKDAGGGYHLFLSKNTLKRGYIHPEREADPRFLIDLGVDDETYMRAVHRALRPDGLMIVYNLYPPQAPDDEDYIPWATGEFPFDRALCEEIGFEIVEWNVPDNEFAHEMARRLGWGERMDIDASLLAMYTILRRK